MLTTETVLLFVFFKRNNPRYQTGGSSMFLSNQIVSFSNLCFLCSTSNVHIDLSMEQEGEFWRVAHVAAAVLHRILPLELSALSLEYACPVVRFWLIRYA